ncbi:PriCT-2 domain-containing protein [Acidithiobacillus sp. HP-11]|uniref:PriCT-2 domain-containing protein n=1 Tax=Acidithiobacillus sp. HP-11 TaxID=2697656 RepID=UPI00187A4E78|nr:PriCT-2 domain-containing protein [Acidithiobacillus sp. HP-11]MBE7567813.1 PriCT-2 domain-containing protein [Acidithiobacillus sp. HP-11]
MSKIAFTRITSNKVISKGFRLRGNGLEKIKGGKMYSGFAERVEIENLQELIPIIQSMHTKQAMAYGTVKNDGTRHAITTKKYQKDGKNIARSRDFFEFKENAQGLFLVDYDPPKEETPLSMDEVLQTLDKVCPAVTKAEKLVISSASSYIYRKSDNTCMKGVGGLHILIRAENAADITAIGEALNARLWLNGFGYIGKTVDGKRTEKSLIDNTVWQPERLFFESGAACGTGLEQRRPPFQYFAGDALKLSEVDLTPDEWEKFHALVAKAKGVKTKPDKSKSKENRQNPAITKRERSQKPVYIAPVEPLTPHTAARIMGALLYVSPEVEYNIWIKIGMGLKTSFGDAGFTIWDNWSKKGNNYPGTQALRAKWLSFDRGAVTVKTVYFYAKQYGWNGKPVYIDLPFPVKILPADQHQKLAKSVCIDEARDQTEKYLESVILDHKPFTVSSAQITVGTGKTTTLKMLFDKIRKSKKKVVIIAKDKKQCGQYEKEGAFWRHGRENSKNGFADQWHCPKADEGGNVQRLGEKEQRLQQMCIGGHCEHGNVYMLEKAKKEKTEPSEKVIKFFKEKPELKNVEPCGWFDHAAESQKYTIRVVTSSGLALIDMVDMSREDVDVLIVDESLAWSHSQFLSVKEIRKYIERLQGLQKKMPDDGSKDKEKEMLETASNIFAEIAEKMGKQAGTAPAGEYQDIKFDMKDIVDHLSLMTDDRGVAPWEKPEWKQWLDLVQTPLRALSAIKDGIRAGSLSLVDGQLHVTYLHPILEHAGKKGIPIVILDATLDSTAQSISSEIKNIVAAPNLDYVIDPRWFIAAKKDEKSLEKEMKDLLETQKNLEAQTKRKSYIICRKTLALFMIGELEKIDENDLRFMPKNELWDLSIICGIGWFGWHDAAHDEWNGRDGIIWGQMPTPDSVRLQEYADHRAALRLLGGGKDLPLPDNKWIDNCEVNTGNHAQISQGRLPEQPEVREWILRKVSNQRIQAAGRSRAVCQSQRMTIWQVGGYPVTGLAEHGIRPTYARLVKGLAGYEVAALHSAKRQKMMTTAAQAAIAAGKQITRETVREFTEQLCKSLITNKSKSSKVVRDAYIYIYQPRTTLSGLESNENNGLEGTLFTDDAGTWDHEYSTWRDTVHAGIRLHFAEHAGSSADLQTQKTEPVQEHVQKTVPELENTEYQPRTKSCELDSNENNTLEDAISDAEMEIVDLCAEDSEDTTSYDVEILPNQRDVQEPDYLQEEEQPMRKTSDDTKEEDDDEYVPGADG